MLESLYNLWPIRGLYRSNGSDTSKQAAESIEVSHLLEQVYTAITYFGNAGCISEDVERSLSDYSQRTITPRYAQLIELGMIERTEERRKAVHTGRMQQVMVALSPPFTKVTTKAKTKIAVMSLRINSLEAETKGLEMENKVFRKLLEEVIETGDLKDLSLLIQITELLGEN